MPAMFCQSEEILWRLIRPTALKQVQETGSYVHMEPNYNQRYRFQLERDHVGNEYIACNGVIVE